jgi:hypothetical protein
MPPNPEEDDSKKEEVLTPRPRRTFTPPEVIEARRIRDYLGSHYGECYAAPEPDCGKCEQCIIREAMERLSGIVEPPHVPVKKYQERLAYNDGVNCEAYFLDAWQMENRPRGSRAISILEHILDDRPTFRDAEVAASVIQWLGTNVGGNFFSKLVRLQARCYEDCREKTKQEQEERNKQP